MLSLPRLIAYALPAVPLAALTLPLYTYIPTFYAEALGVPLAALGFALFAVRLFDAVNDPVIGVLADRFRPSFGRRRTWFLASIPLVMLGVWNLFWPPEGAGVWHVALWTLVLSVGYTCAILPYNAWGAELDTSYEGRARIAATREGLTLTGTMVAIVLIAWLGWDNATEFHGFAALAVLLLVLLPLFGGLAVVAVPEPREHSRRRVRVLEGFRELRHNRPFLRLLAAYVLNGFGNSLAASLFLFYAGQRLGLADERGPLLLVFFVAGVFGIPFWTWLARRTSKHRSWCLAMVFAILVFWPTPFLPEGALVPFAIICVLSGLSLGADITLPAAVAADVIDVDTARTGEQRSGTYFALWGLATKMSLALTAALALPLLAWVGFDADNSAASSATSLTLLAFLYGWGPIVMKAAAVWLMWRFPLDREAVLQLRRAIEDDRSAQTPREGQSVA